MNQGKTPDQIKDSNTFAGYAFLALVLFAIVVSFTQWFNEINTP